MDTFITGYISGIISSLAVYIFIQSIRKRKGSTSSAIQSDIDRNNISTERGLGSLKTNNRESGKIIDIATGEARRGLEAIDNTNRTVSEIIADAKREGRPDD